MSTAGWVLATVVAVLALIVLAVLLTWPVFTP